MESDFELLLSICFFLIVICSAAVYVWMGKRESVAEPVSQFLFFYPLFVLPLPLRAYLTKQAEGDVTEHIGSLVPYMPWALALSTVGVPLFLLGYYARLSWRLASYVPVPKRGLHVRTAFLVLAAISGVQLWLLSRNAGSLLDLLLLGYGGSSEAINRGYLSVGFTWLWIASLFLLYRYSLRKEKLDVVLFGCMIFINIAIDVLTGQRGLILYFGIAIYLFWHHAVRALSIKKMALGALLAFAALNLLGAIRDSNYEDFSDLWNRTAETYGKASDSTDTFFYTLTTGEFVVPFETLPQMIRSVGNSISPRLGSTYLRAPLFVIPNTLFPKRPLPLANWYMQEFYGGGIERNEGRQFFFLSEGYLNFGPLGVLLTMLAWGLFWGAVAQYRRLASGEPGALLLYALTVAFMFRGIAGEFESVSVGLPFQHLSAALLGLWITRFRKESPRYVLGGPSIGAEALGRR